MSAGAEPDGIRFLRLRADRYCAGRLLLFVNERMCAVLQFVTVTETSPYNILAMPIYNESTIEHRVYLR